MAQIGSPQGITVPTIGVDSDITAATKIVNALNTLIGAVEGSVPMSAVAWGADKTASGYGLYGVGYLGLNQQGAAGATAGRIENVNGDLYWVSAAGAVQITDGSGLNAAGIGGIGGDYGGTDPALVSYSDASSLYEFTTDPGVYAHVKVNQLWITGAGIGLLKLDSAATGTQTWTFPAALPGVASVLTVDAAGAVVASNTLAQDLTLNAHLTIGAGKVIKHPEKTIQLSTYDFLQSSGTITPNANGGVVGTNGANGVWQLGGLEVGTRIKAIKIRYNGADAVAKNLWLYKYVDGVQTLIDSTTAASAGVITITLTLATPEVVVSGTKYVVSFTFRGAGADAMYSMELIYDRV